MVMMRPRARHPFEPVQSGSAGRLGSPGTEMSHDTSRRLTIDTTTTELPTSTKNNNKNSKVVFLLRQCGGERSKIDIKSLRGRLSTLDQSAR